MGKRRGGKNRIEFVCNVPNRNRATRFQCFSARFLLRWRKYRVRDVRSFATRESFSINLRTLHWRREPRHSCPPIRTITYAFLGSNTLNWEVDRDGVLSGVMSDTGVSYQVFVAPELNTFGPVSEGVYPDSWIVCAGTFFPFQLSHPVTKGSKVFIQAGGGANISLFFDDSFPLPAET